MGLNAGPLFVSTRSSAGKPDQKLTPWGSFEGGTSIVRNAVVWAGMPDPGLTRHAVQDGDEDTAALRELIRALNLVDPQQKGLQVAEMVRIAQQSDYGIPGEHSEVLRDAIEEFTQLAIQNAGNRLAYRLKSVRRRIVGAHYLDRKTVNGQRLWVVCGPEIHTASGDSVQGAHGEARVHIENGYVPHTKPGFSRLLSPHGRFDGHSAIVSSIYGLYSTKLIALREEEARC